MKTVQSVEIEPLLLVLKTLYDDAVDADARLREHLERIALNNLPPGTTS